MIEDGILLKQGKGLFAISNLGALTFAKDLNCFSRLWTKALRIVKYQGNDILKVLEDKVFLQGYALIFKESLKLIRALLPKESIEPAKRACFLTIITEFLANTLKHQDFACSGFYPVVEILDDCI